MAEPAAAFEDRIENGDKKMGEMPVESCSDVGVTDMELRRVPGAIPMVLFLICLLEFAERFVYLGINGPLQNYIQNPYPYNEAGVPGALGGGQQLGTALGDTFKFFSYFCTVIGAVIADEYLGKYKTIMVTSPIYIAGLILLVVTSAPMSIRSGAALGGLIASILLIGLGTGCLKACIAPLCGEQTLEHECTQKVLKTGETVIVDPKLTIQRTFMWYYWAANIGSLSTLITTNIEKEIGFWLAYLVPLLVFMVVISIIIFFNQKIVKIPAASESPLKNAWATLMISLKQGGLEKAKPSYLVEHNRLEKYKFARTEKYTDLYVEEVKKGLKACKYFVLFPIFFLCWTQIFNNLISQAGSMELNGTPNDILQSLQTIFMLGFIPLFDLIIYPALRKVNIIIGPVARVSLGFFATALSMAYASVLQHYIYRAPPSSINVWLQTPCYVFGALGEIWVVVTGLELAFTRAPENLKTVVASVFWVTVALGSALGIGLSPVSTDPYMVKLYAALAGAAFVAGLGFTWWFWEEMRDV